MVYNDRWSYEYDLKDHLGNTRCSFSADTAMVKPLQYKDYYPFGLEMANNYVNDPNATKYRYNGKELQDEGVDLNNDGEIDLALDWYDYGARFYDPAIGRWHSIDPRTEIYSSYSPYNYCLDNPLKFIDPNGEAVDYSNLYEKDKDGKYKYEQQIIAFELFASTKVGKAYLLAHAQKGFSLTGAFIKGLNISAAANGAKHNAGVDVAFEARENYNNEGGTEHQLTDNNTRLSITYVLDGDQTSMGNTPNELLNRTRNWTHEVFYHGEYYENRFSDFKNGKVSLNSNGSLWTEENYWHWMPLNSTKFGRVGSGLLQETQNIIHSYDANSIIFRSRYPSQARIQRTRSNLANPQSAEQIKEMLKYGLPHEK